jgi:hypothetical protein
MDLPDEVREHCAAVAARARFVRIVPDAPVEPGGGAGLDPELHLLEARYILILDAINFGSGWFGELGTDTDTLTAALSAHCREHGVSTEFDVAAVLSLPPEHELTRLYTEALRQLRDWLRRHDPLAFATAAALARALAEMPFYADAGFYKRAQITANDLVLAGVAEFPDVDRLTAFADNLVPHVLRVDGMLEYAPELAARVDAGEELPAGSAEEVEIRACAVHACELLAARWGVPPRVLDNWLWNRGQGPPYSDGRAHMTKTVFY